jgi:hypothetical protein
MLGMLRYHGEPDVFFADGTSGDGFSFRWCPAWGCPAFNGGKGPFHEIWEYTPAALGFTSHWMESSNLFRKLRYEENLTAAGDLLGRIADCELAALDLMDRAWPEVRSLR